MAKLNQIVAVEKGAKGHLNDAITAAYHRVQKPELFSGIARTYKSKSDDGDQLPPESTRVQQTAEGLLEGVTRDWTRLLDVTATKDWANARAVADVVVDGETVIAAAPVTYLVWLEKQLNDVRTFVTKLPVLDPAFEWEPSGALGASWATPIVQTTRTKKVPQAFVKYDATPEHPAQVDGYTVDVVEGTWDTTKFSGAVPQDRVNELLARVDELQSAVKMAREEANGIDVTDQNAGRALFTWLLS